MESSRHTRRYLDSSNRFAQHILRVQNQHFALVNLRLIHIAEQKAAILTTGRALASQMLASDAAREELLQAIGRIFFPSQPAVWRERAKVLINRLDMDGSFSKWCSDFGVRDGQRTLDSAQLMVGGRPFDLATYIAEQPLRTQEIGRRFPRMLAFTRRVCPTASGASVWAQGKPLSTLKSYILQEAEGISRDAKRRWCTAHGHRCYSLQHDGVVIGLRASVSPSAAAQDLQCWTEAALGYPQPVTVKPMSPAGQLSPVPHPIPVPPPPPPGADPDPSSESFYVRTLRSHFRHLQSVGMAPTSRVQRVKGTAPSGLEGRRDRLQGSQQRQPSQQELEADFLQRYILSYQYGSVKTHKSPFGWRFLAGGS